MTALIGSERPLRVIRRPLSVEEINRMPDNELITLPVGPAAKVPVLEAVFWSGHFVWTEEGEMIPDVVQVRVGGLTPGARIRTLPDGSVALDATSVLEERQSIGWIRVDHIIGDFPDNAEWDLDVKREYTAPLKTTDVLARLIDEGCDVNDRALKQLRIGTGLLKRLRPARLDREEDLDRKQAAANKAKAELKAFQAALTAALKPEPKPKKSKAPDGAEPNKETAS